MEAIGAALRRLTDSPSHSDALTKRPERPIAGDPTTIAECRALAAWAESLPPESEQPASDNFIVNRIAFMQAALPARGVDEAAGEKRTAVYLSILRGHSREALTYMADKLCRTSKWFPTPKECLDTLAEYRRPESERTATLRLCASFATAAMHRWLANVADGQPLGDVPDDWLRIAVERGSVRRLDDGGYVSRAMFVGPTMAGKLAA